MEQQPRVCPRCGQALSPEDTIVFGYGLLGHLDCRRPRVLSAEERTLLFIYCRDHQVAECVHCAGRFHLRDVTSLDSLGIRSHRCPWCHTDLTDSIRAHLYGCAMLPMEIQRRAQAAREAVRSLVNQSRQLSDAADVLLREAEAALHALRDTMRQAPTLSATRETKQQGGQIRLLLPRPPSAPPGRRPLLRRDRRVGNRQPTVLDRRRQECSRFCAEGRSARHGAGSDVGRSRAHPREGASAEPPMNRCRETADGRWCASWRSARLPGSRPPPRCLCG